MQTRRKGIFATVCFGALWVAALTFGLRALLSYESAPGPVGAVPSSWPARSTIERATSGKTLIMVVHPRCPCTRASMGELAQIMARLQGKVRGYVLFVKPRSFGADWDDTELHRRAAEIPGVTVLSDLDGAEAHLFGTETSGHTLLFDSAGRLMFSGGITGSRGHAGGNAGENAIIALANDQSAGRAETLVFGCSLTEKTRAAGKALCLN